MHTLSDLRSGRLAGATYVKISAGLADFPAELFGLVDSLEKLDLSGNCLSSLPDDFSRFTKLHTLFLSDNHFRSFPAVLSGCEALGMVGFKANQIADLPEGALPASVRWLILTDNKISQLPRSIGRQRRLQKLMLAGNRLRSLPDEMANCINLELLRVSANRLATLPAWLVALPKLSWLAFAGNPCSEGDARGQSLDEAPWQSLQLGRQLGEGASGVISQARWKGESDVAIKVFKGHVTSDGLPADEMAAAMAAGQHSNLIKLLGRLVGHPEGKCGLLLALLDNDYKNLAGPPSLLSCTRDTYAEGATFTLPALLKIAHGIASVAEHLHRRGIMHGDLYGHNILVNLSAETLLGDFGAATIYKNMLNADQFAHALERLEVRAFGCLLEELLMHLEERDREAYPFSVSVLERLQQECMVKRVGMRHGFAAVLSVIETEKARVGGGLQGDIPP